MENYRPHIRINQNTTDAHPMVIGDLNRSEMKYLTEILHLDSTTQPRYDVKAQKLIKGLPTRLRYKRLSLTGLGIKATGLCDLHRPMNAEVLQDILSLVRREVTTCFRPYDHYPEHVNSPEADLLVRLRGFKGMWTKPSPTPNVGVQSGTWEYQINECAGCMLSRIAADENAIANLRAAIISRTRTGTKHKPRRLMPFVDECINQHYPDKAEAIFNISCHYAYGLKETRKACTKASSAVHGRLRIRRKDRNEIGAESSGVSNEQETGLEQNVPDLLLNSDIEWAVPTFPPSSGSRYSRDVPNLGNSRSDHPINRKLTGLCRDLPTRYPQYNKVTSSGGSEYSDLMTDMMSQIDDAIEESSMYRLVYDLSSSESDPDADYERDDSSCMTFLLI